MHYHHKMTSQLGVIAQMWLALFSMLLHQYHMTLEFDSNTICNNQKKKKKLVTSTLSLTS
jgi:hypothetical protein